MLDSFSSRLYGSVIILWLIDGSQEPGQAFTVYYTTSVGWSCESDRLNRLQPNCFAFTDHTSVIIYMFIYYILDRLIDR